jgi:hypothetical protein
MRTNVDRILRAALRTLEVDKIRLERQIEALRAAVRAISRRNSSASVTDNIASGRGIAPSSRPTRRGRMSRAARRTVSERMRAYWAKRRAQVAKEKRKRAA